jgi:hypothetical protein
MKRKRYGTLTLELLPLSSTMIITLFAVGVMKTIIITR